MRKQAMMAIAALVSTRGAAAQEVAPAEPSTAALTLARAMLPPSDAQQTTMLAANVADRIRGMQLAYRGQGCDTRLPACRAAADAIARQAAPAIAAGQRETRARALAIIFDAKMTAQELGKTLAFVTTPAGQKLAASINALTNYRSLSPDLQRRVTNEMMRPPADAINLVKLAEQFYDQTRDLPRGQMLPGPPAPLAPFAPKRP